MADIQTPLVVSDRREDSLRDTGFVVGPDGNSIVAYRCNGHVVDYKPGNWSVDQMLAIGPVYFVSA